MNRKSMLAGLLQDDEDVKEYLARLLYLCLRERHHPVSVAGAREVPEKLAMWVQLNHEELRERP